MSNEYNSESIEEAFTRFLNEGKFRKTQERYAILRKALEMNTHFEVDALHIAIESDGYHVSRATVYNTVELLEKAGILRKNVFGQNSAIYEVNRDNHIHLVCKRCGKIREIDNAHIAAHVMQLKPDNFTPESFAITLYGICGECSHKEKN
ncbi:MAG: transcriptional repressor [Muribaculaceae bacterium]|nr:transcriptional repressor [Muribaculaceae bacterium]